MSGATRPKVVGLSASLRNSRFGAGSEALVADLNAIESRAALNQYLREQAKICLEDFVKAGREEGLAFDEMYRNLQRRKGDRGLSNSEVALAAGLWGIKNQGVDIEHIGLAKYFPSDGNGARQGELKEKLANADGILLSGPVYFGDRGSIAHGLIQMIRDDRSLQQRLAGKIYAGISVGAKRNGGQETTLIYQLLDMCELGFLSVGNDAGTTSQYGGTCVAGDVGTMADDEYGLNTAIGTGNRFGQVVSLMHHASGKTLKRKLRISAWLLQDRDEAALRYVQGLSKLMDPERVELTIFDFTKAKIRRCLACDICPTHVAADEEYRCIVQNETDLFASDHTRLIDTDAILICGYSPKDLAGTQSVYQKFIERTRYIRRGDYIWSNLMTAPLVLEEVGARENLAIRMMTSMVRHNTVMHHPLIAHEHRGEVLNRDEVERRLDSFVNEAFRITAGTLHAASLKEAQATLYNPVGYVLSVDKDNQDKTLQLRRMAIEQRFERKRQDALISLSTDGGRGVRRA